MRHPARCGWKCAAAIRVMLRVRVRVRRSLRVRVIGRVGVRV